MRSFIVLHMFTTKMVIKSTQNKIKTNINAQNS